MASSIGDRLREALGEQAYQWEVLTKAIVIRCRLVTSSTIGHHTNGIFCEAHGSRLAELKSMILCKYPAFSAQHLVPVEQCWPNDAPL